MTEPIKLRYIPFRQADISAMCLESGVVPEIRRARYERGREHIEAHFQQEFHRRREILKNLYAGLDPDADTRNPLVADTLVDGNDFLDSFEQTLQRANYRRVSREELEAAFKSASLFQVKLHVDLSHFEQILLYFRGASREQEELRYLFGLWRREISFIRFERVVLCLKLREDLDPDQLSAGCRPGSTLLKLFQNVPEADIEMLFPNTRVGMRLSDKLLIGVPAAISGGMVFTTKLGATLVLLGSLFGYWLGLHGEPVELNRKALLVLFGGAAALGAFLWRQFNKYRNRRLRFQQALTENLYFKLLDTNAGVIFRLLNDAEESECKECLLAYAFLLQADGPVAATELDRRIEDWFSARWQCDLNFDVEDALNKLVLLGLAQGGADSWQITHGHELSPEPR